MDHRQRIAGCACRAARALRHDPPTSRKAVPCRGPSSRPLDQLRHLAIERATCPCADPPSRSTPSGKDTRSVTVPATTRTSSRSRRQDRRRCRPHRECPTARPCRRRSLPPRRRAARRRGRAASRRDQFLAVGGIAHRSGGDGAQLGHLHLARQQGEAGERGVAPSPGCPGRSRRSRPGPCPARPSPSR
jgi:hypothetical protein